MNVQSRLPERLSLPANLHKEPTHVIGGWCEKALDKLNFEKPLEIKAYQYDIVCNGIELSSGAIRNHIPNLMYKLFSIAGYNKKMVDEKYDEYKKIEGTEKVIPKDEWLKILQKSRKHKNTRKTVKTHFSEWCPSGSKKQFV